MTETKMAGHTQGVCERRHHQQHETRRQGYRGVERSCHGCRQWSDATRRHKVEVIISYLLGTFLVIFSVQILVLLLTFLF